SALAGPRHGGATTRVYKLLEDARQSRDVRRLIGSPWRQGEDLPGFGHALYPEGDPRASELLAMPRTQPVPEQPMALLEAVIAAAEGVAPRRPNVGFMPGAICFAYGLPAAPALSIFAAGRLAGWLAHVLEQQALGRLIRPRASYTG